MSQNSQSNAKERKTKAKSMHNEEHIHIDTLREGRIIHFTQQEKGGPNIIFRSKQIPL